MEDDNKKKSYLLFDKQEKQDSHKNNIIITIIKISGAIFIVGFAIYAWINFHKIEDNFIDFITWLQNNIVLGAILIIFIYIVIVAFMIPQMILTIGSGFAYTKAFGSVFWAMFLGTFTTFIGAGLGALVAQFISRFILRDFVKGCFKGNKKFDAIERAV